MKRLERRRQFFRSLEAKSLRARPISTQIADKLTSWSGKPFFLFGNAFFFASWIVINTGFISEIQPFDPYPFGFLTMIVSLEAIFLSIFVLISQNRSAKISTIREEVHLRIDMIAEEEITKILEVLAEIRKKMGIDKKDPELEQMLEQVNTNYIETSIADQLTRANKPLVEQLRKDFPDLLLNVIKKPIQMVNTITPTKEEKNDKQKIG